MEGDVGPRGARLSSEADYEGGVWIDGEFYYEKKRGGRVQTKDEAIYGVFGESSRAYNPQPRRGRFTVASLAKPVAFVGGDLYKSADVADVYQKDKHAETPETPETPAPESQEPGVPEAAAGLARRREARLRRERVQREEDARSGRGGRGGVGSGAREGFASSARGGLGSARTAKHTDRDFGKFQKLSGGLGLKLLQKMGYKSGGLGRRGQGIVNPVKAALRPQQMGLGYGGYKEKINFSQAELDAKEAEKSKAKNDVASESGGRGGGGARRQRPANWRRGAAKPKRVYKTVSELRGKAEARAAPELVIDMRGPNVRVASLDRVGELLASDPRPAEDDEDGWTPTAAQGTLPELKWNVDALVEHTEAAVHKALGAARAAESKVAALRGQQKSLKKRVESVRRNVMSFSRAVAAAEAALREAKGSGGAPLDKAIRLAQAFAAIRRDDELTYCECGLPLVAASASSKLVKSALISWNPSLAGRRGPSTENVVGALRALRTALSRANGDEAVYEALLTEAVLSPLTLALSMAPPREFEGPVRLLAAMKNVLTAPIRAKVLNTAIGPRLLAQIKAWDPRRDRSSPLHAWVHPWLDVLPSDSLHPVLNAVRERVASTLTRWDPKDRSAVELIRPWVRVWPPKGLWDVLSRSVMPKLRRIASSLCVNPSNEDPADFRAIVDWAGVAPSHALADILLRHFFPKWLQALAQWLRGDPDFQEVTDWYRGWKSLIPDALRSHPVVVAQLKRGLSLIAAGSEGRSLDPILRGAAAAFEEQVDGLRREAEAEGHSSGGMKDSGISAAAKRVRAAAAAAAGGAGGVNFREALSRFAMKNDVVFVPHPTRGPREGAPVFKFGRCNIILSGQNVLVENKQTGRSAEWRPVALDQLVAMAK